MTDVDEAGSSSAGILFAGVSAALESLASGSCVADSNSSVSVLDVRSPSRGLSKGAGDDVRPPFIAAPKGSEEEDDWLDMGMS